MPIDLFIGKSNVQTYVYVFRVNEPHQADDTVKFIDFSNDGYTRTNRKKASINLRDTDHAKDRYEEVVQLVRFGKEKLKYLTEKEYYEGKIDPKSGADWNQSAPVLSPAQINFLLAKMIGAQNENSIFLLDLYICKCIITHNNETNTKEFENDEENDSERA